MLFEDQQSNVTDRRLSDHRPKSFELVGARRRKRQELTCGADIIQDGVCPDFGVDRFDKGGHFGRCVVGVVVAFVAVTLLDGLGVLASKSEKLALGRKLGAFGDSRTDPRPRKVRL
jgi:hypothetical protein